MKVSDLTLGEKLQLERRRRKESQKGAARRWGVSLYEYRKAETDKVLEHYLIKTKIQMVRDYEACYIKRIRKRLFVYELAETLQVSEWWLIQMEEGEQDYAQLMRYWARRGPRRSKRKSKTKVSS